MQGDHYAVLGVGRDAGEDAIQSAYRKLARQWHPDVNSDGGAAAQFATVSQAYAILGNRARRETYDRSLRSETVGPPPPIVTQPIRCTECGDVTAQPRILVFRSTIGILVWNRVQRIEGVFCSRCARRSGIRASLVTAIAGWWAAPFGPFFTAWCIFANAAGGSRRQRADRRLALVNAQAFLERRHLDLAHALAREALEGRHGVDGSDAEAARAIIERSRPKSAYLRPLVLKDPWRADIGYIATHVLLLLAVPLSAGIAIWLLVLQ
jgi:curved DNA-binding protein CbpA